MFGFASLTGVALSMASLSMGLPIDGSQGLPTVDLSYALHQAITFNQTYNFYKFQNIRYAQAPVGNLRWRAPQVPLSDRKGVQNGSIPRVCPQGLPLWQEKAGAPITKATLGERFTIPTWEAEFANVTVPSVDVNIGTTEDCLFLDVFVPPQVLANASSRKAELHKGAPVLVWIHGGGFVLGSKDAGGEYDPSGLMQYSQQENSEGIVYIAINYRLGAVGFLASEEFDGDLNVGLHDQRLALQWVQENAHLFGGDASRVTVMGESAGAGSILHHLTAYGGQNGSSLFVQAIAQSPATLPPLKAKQSSFDDFLSAMNVSSLAEARKLPSESVIAANAQVLYNAPTTNYIYTPIIDGDLIPASPKSLFQSGNYNKSIKVLTAVNSFEGGFFFDPNVQTEADFSSWISRSFTLNQPAIEYLRSTLYPPVFDGSLGYIDQDTRQMTLWSESVFYDHVELLNEFYPDTSYSYEFSVAPGIHTQDLSYTFNDATLPGPLPSPKAQQILQRAITSFVINGVPMVYDNQTYEFPHWNAQTRQVINLTDSGAAIGVRKANQTRCEFWQDGVYKF